MYIKYCGFQTEEDVKKAVKEKIDAVGFIHYPKSNRHQSIEAIKLLSKCVPESITSVAVVVNPTKEILQNLIEQSEINAIQFHGHEELALFRWCQKYYPHIQLIKALPADDELTKMVHHYRNNVSFFIIDTPSIHYGGTGQSFDWHILEPLDDVPYLVAGGMSIDKIKQFESLQLNAMGFDIASGIETEGKKDPYKMHEIASYLKGER